MTLTKTLKKLFIGTGAAAILAGSPLYAGDMGKAVIQEPVEEESLWTFCNLFDYATLYEGDGFVNKIKFIGRYHGQYTDTQTDSSDPRFNRGGRAWDHRRWRAGIQVDFANDFTFKNTYNLDNSFNFDGPRFIESVEDMVIEWNPDNDLYVIVGKQKANITREWTMSSKRIRTFERSTIVNNVISDKIWGIVGGFNMFDIDHELGIYANAYEDDWRWPAFKDAVPVFKYSAGKQIYDNLSLHFDYQYVDQGYNGSETNNSGPYRHALALGTEGQWGRFALILDLIAGYDRRDGRLSLGDDSHGIVILPSYEITDRLEAVFRYAYASDAQLGRPADVIRNVSASTLRPPDVDGLHTFYAGLTYRICGDKLKLMAGYQYADAKRIVGTNNDWSNNTWLFGVRTYW